MSLLTGVEDSDRRGIIGPDHLPKARPAGRYLSHEGCTITQLQSA